MFREVMADYVKVLLLKVEYKIRESMLVLIRNNNIKAGIISLCRRKEGGSTVYPDSRRRNDVAGIKGG